jgi:leucyl-tRNA synthetase
VQFRLRDWGVSRQRYWGCPIPIVHCDACGTVPVPDDQLPVGAARGLRARRLRQPAQQARRLPRLRLPEVRQAGPARNRHHGHLRRFVLVLRALLRRSGDARGEHAMVDAGSNHWMPADQYIGGIEHAILHLLYSRFWTKVMRDLGLVNYDEPFANLLTQGMVLNHIFSRRTDKGGIEYYAPEEVELKRDEGGHVIGATSKADGQPVDYGGVGTMSKSKRNGVDPQELIETYGADTARFFMMFASPAGADPGMVGFRCRGRLPFPEAGLGLRPCLSVAVGTAMPANAGAGPAAVRREIHLLLKQANYDLGKLQFNTVASAAMKMLNALEKAPRAGRSPCRQ